MKTTAKLLLFNLAFLLFSSSALAFSGDISINQNNVRFSSDNFLEGRAVRIYATVTNHSTQDLLGTVRFFSNDQQIGGDQAISLFGGKTDDVFIDWSPAYGSHKVAVKIFPWEETIDNPSNNWISTNIFAAQDTDRDGIPNATDEDDDNDGVPDVDDHFPLDPNEQVDTDGDGVGDNADEDNDNDDVPDDFDDLPLDPNETIDTDGDGIGNIADLDDDGDGILDTEEENTNTDPLNADSDRDGTTDKEDSFPLDDEEWLDTDDDNIGNNTDTDDDNDGLADQKDDFPLNKGPVIKLHEEDFTVNIFEEYTFDASDSYDDDGNIVSYIWEIDDDTTIEGNAFTHVFKEKGDHRVKLTIIDDSGESRTSLYDVNVGNNRQYLQIGAVLIILFLASLIIFKYISVAENPKNSKKAHK